MLGAAMDTAADIYSKGSGHHLFVAGLFDELVRMAKDLPTSYFYGRRFGFQVPRLAHGSSPCSTALAW
jgi:hypothetical protein